MKKFKKNLKNPRKSQNFSQKPDLLKKTPAENACAFDETGIYTHLSKFIAFYRFFTEIIDFLLKLSIFNVFATWKIMNTLYSQQLENILK
jgi:hypothetical protein